MVRRGNYPAQVLPVVAVAECRRLVCLPGLAFRARNCHTPCIVLQPRSGRQFEEGLIVLSQGIWTSSSHLQGRLGTVGGIGENFSGLAWVIIRVMLRTMSNAGPHLPTLRGRLHSRLTCQILSCALRGEGARASKALAAGREPAADPGDGTSEAIV